jgi:glutathione S-transferase
LQDKIELVGIDLQDKPAWYKEKVYEQGTVQYTCSSFLHVI